MKPPKFAVDKRAVPRIEAGHPWVFANELAVPARELPPGGTVDITAVDGRFLGRGYANPASLIAVRLCTRAKGQTLDLPGFWAEQLRSALELRQALFPGETAWRWIHGESDGIPGVVIDRFDDVIAAQITTLGMEQRRDALLAAIRDVLPSLRGAVLRNDVKVRELEGLEQGREVWFGDVPDAVTIREGDVRYVVSPLGGQKTGHFFDQRLNREFAAPLCRGRRVLDVYSNSGGWGLHALHAGATQAVFVDKSADACALVERNLAENGFADRGVIVQDEGRRALMELVAQGQRFGAVVLDPPAFAKTRKAAGAALKGYREINALGLQLVEPGGFLFTSSCSHHIVEDRLLEAINDAARETGKTLRLVRRGEQGPDHPVLPAMPESRYLKSWAFQVQPVF
jgi:23S rRNA (cytosine1962-C5)-methyltransferase